MEALFPERKKHKSQVAKLKFDMINVFILRGPEYYEDIREIYEEFPFQVMVADITFGAIPFVNEKMRIPVITVSVVPLPETSRDLAPSGLGITPSDSLAGRIFQDFMRFLANRLLFAQPTKVMKDILSAHGIETGGTGIFDIIIQTSTLVLQSGSPGFEYRRSDLSPHIHFAGPLLPYVKKNSENRWYHPKMTQFDKVILVTQGTVERDIEKLIVPTLEAFKGSDRLVIVTTGGSGTEELRKRYPQENFIIEDFIPFSDVMPHADVYISNGGYGGVLLSIQNEVPMVVAGVHEGKNEINARVGYFGLGVNLKTETPLPRQISAAVEKVIDDNSYFQNVKKLNSEFSLYPPGLILEKLISKLLQKNGKRIKEAKETEWIY
jgi:hypothetical protein